MKQITGNIFTSSCQTLVNTINCVGVMGAGIALEFKLRHPAMFQRYLTLCRDQQISIGKLWLYKKSAQWVLNFPTKKHWRYPSKPVYLEQGLEKFMETYQQRNITSIAFPLLGAAKGGLSETLSLNIMETFLQACTIPVEIYHYDPNAYDDLFEHFRQRLLTCDEAELIQLSGLRQQTLNKLKIAVETSGVHSLSQLVTVPGIGVKSVEKAFALMR